MSATTIFVIAIVAAAVLASAGVFVIAARRDPDDGPITGEFDKRAVQKDEEARRAREFEGVSTIVQESETETETILEDADAAPEVEETVVVDEPSPDSMLERVEITRAEYAVTRRKFLNRATLGLFGGVFLGGQLLAYLAFLWPKLKGGFGTKFNVGNVEEIRAQIVGPSITPKFFAAAQTWIVPFEADQIAGSSFEGLPVLAAGEGDEPGLMALWQRCVHLGCRVPDCVPSQGFECPCHGSRYNFHGEYEAGPAPRNLDRFEVTVNDAGDLIVNTGAIFQTARSKNKTISYPQGPSCI